MNNCEINNNNLERAALVKLVREWAEVNTDAILDTKTQIFSIPSIHGVIGYRIELGNAVVYGDPVASPHDKIALAKEFEKFCKAQKIQIIYIIVSEEFAHLAHNHLPFSSIEFGSKYILDPSNFKEPQSPLLRKKIRQSTKSGVEVIEYTGSNHQIERDMEALASAWVQARKGIQMYIATPSIFTDRLGKRWLYAKHEGKIIGFLVLNRLESVDGWLLNNVMVAKGAPSGVSEHLVLSALQSLEKENCHFVLIGPVPAQELGKIVGVGRVLTFLARLAFKLLKKPCRLDGHEIFWEKFQPHCQSSYLLFPRIGFHPTVIGSLLRGLNISVY